MKENEMNWNKLLIGTTLVGTVLVAGLVSPAAACPNCWGHGPTLTGEDRAKADEIRKPYEEDLNAFKTQLRAKSRELGRVIAAEDASQAETLRGELTDLERANDAVRTDLRDDLHQAGLAGYAGTAGWTCQGHDDHGWRDEHRGRRMARNGGYGQRAGCRW